MTHLVKMQDGRAAALVARWTEPQRFNGRNMVGAYTGEEFYQCDLGRSISGLWLALPASAWQGDTTHPYEITPEEAAGWFAACGLELPDELAEIVL